MTRWTRVVPVAALALLLTGCAAPATPVDGAPAVEAIGPAAPAGDAVQAAPELQHVHAVVADPVDGALIASHTGVYRIGADGSVTGPLGGADFDAMGFAVAGDTLYASGHPGTATPAELGAPNLGLIASDDAGVTWRAVAFTGVEDFHAFTTGPDGSIHGIRSTTGALASSTDGGATWTDGAALAAIDLAVGADGRLLAAGEQGVLVSTDAGATFAPDPTVPPLYRIERLADGRVAGVAQDGGIHVRDAAGAWTRTGALDAPAEALGADADGALLVVDDRGLARVALDGTRAALHPLDR